MFMHPTPGGDATGVGARSFRLTARGRACVELVKAETEVAASLSRYLRDVLLLCGTGSQFQQLQQSVPPRPLAKSLQSLIDLGLVEVVQRPLPQESAADGRLGRLSGFGPLQAG